MDEHTQRIGFFLLSNGCKSMEEWALDHGYGYNKHMGSWHNDEGQYIDLEEEILRLIDGE